MVCRRVKNKNNINSCSSATDWNPFVNWIDMPGLSKILLSVFIQKEFQSKNNIHIIICYVSISASKIQYAMLVLVRNEKMPRGNWTKAQKIFYFCMQEALIISFQQL